MGSLQSKVVALQYAAPLRYAAPYSTPPLRSSSRSRHLSRAPSVKPTSSLRSLWRRADQHRNALLLVFEPDLQLNAVRPNVDVALRRQIAFLPGIVLVDPTILETGNGAPLLTVTNELPRAATCTTIDKSSSAISTSGTTLRLLELACVLPEQQIHGMSNSGPIRSRLRRCFRRSALRLGSTSSCALKR